MGLSIYCGREGSVIAAVVAMTFLILLLACCLRISTSLLSCRSGRIEAEGRDQLTSTPTTILLPCGRIVVVDGSTLARFHADRGAPDLFELGERMLGTSGSIARSVLRMSPEADDYKEADVPSRLPPTYESLFGESGRTSRPPPYAEGIDNGNPEELQID